MMSIQGRELSTARRLDSSGNMIDVSSAMRYDPTIGAWVECMMTPEIFIEKLYRISARVDVWNIENAQYNIDGSKVRVSVGKNANIALTIIFMAVLKDGTIYRLDKYVNTLDLYARGYCSASMYATTSQVSGFYYDVAVGDDSLSYQDGDGGQKSKSLNGIMEDGCEINMQCSTYVKAPGGQSVVSNISVQLYKKSTNTPMGSRFYVGSNWI